jgi:hypothetical protein
MSKSVLQYSLVGRGAAFVGTPRRRPRSKRRKGHFLVSRHKPLKSRETAKEKVWKSLEKAWNFLVKVWKYLERLGNPWKS